MKKIILLFLLQFSVLGFAQSLDTTFDPGTGADGNIHAIAIQPDGKIIVGGWFVNFNGASRYHLARLNADGSLDNSFNLGTDINSDIFLYSMVRSIILQPDGKIIIGGIFSTFNNVGRNGIARLNKDGSLDTTFNPGAGVKYASNPGDVHNMAVQP